MCIHCERQLQYSLSSKGDFKNESIYRTTVIDEPISKGGLYGGPTKLPTQGDIHSLNTKALLMGFNWASDTSGLITASQIKYAFPASSSAYTAEANYPALDLLSTFAPLTEKQKEAVRAALALVDSYTNLKFVESESALETDATLRFAQYSPESEGSEARFPTNNGDYSASNAREAGDNFLGQNARFNTNSSIYGTDAFATIAHELGHSLGLKHGHDPDHNGALTPDRDDSEFSIMTYASYLGAPRGESTEAKLGSTASSFMMYDISALQQMYGADFSALGTTRTYRWDQNTGQQFINDIAAPNSGTTVTNKIFSTVWTQGATTTFDLSNFTDDASLDMRPGQWMTFSRNKLADLNSEAASGTLSYKAKGNIYNSLLFNGDTRSALKNIIAGSGNDNILGNEIDNILIGGKGNDILNGGLGLDTASYNLSRENFVLSKDTNSVIIRDTLQNRNGTDTLISIERIDFTDGDLIFDVSSANAPAAYRLYGGAFDRTPDEGGFRYWTDTLDSGVTLQRVAGSFLVSKEFTARYGTSLSNQSFVEALYQNVLHRPGEAAGISYWNDVLNKNLAERAEILVSFTQLPEYVGLSLRNIETGFWVV